MRGYLPCLFTVLAFTGLVYGVNVSGDFGVGVWWVRSSVESTYPWGHHSTVVKPGPKGIANFRVAGETVGFEFKADFQGYRGDALVNTFGVSSRLPVYCTPVPIRLYVAPTLGGYRTWWPGGEKVPAEAQGVEGNMLSGGGDIGIRVTFGRRNSGLDLSYGYQIRKYSGASKFAASYRIINAKAVIGISSRIGLALTAGVIEEGWVFTQPHSPHETASIGTLYLGSPYIIVGPYFSF